MGRTHAFVALLALGSPVVAQIALPPAGTPRFEAGAWPSGRDEVVVADANSDGYLDWLAVGEVDVFGIPSRLTVGLNSGSMRFSVLTHSIDGYTAELAVGDMDADGQLDVLTLATTPWSVAVRLGDGLGGFTKVELVTFATHSKKPRLADLDGDGLAEALALADGPDQLQVMHAQGAGQLSFPVGYAAGAPSFSYALGDVDQDGDVDALVSGALNLQLLPGNGTGGFAAPVPLIGTSPAAAQIEVADVDADGALDAVARDGATGDKVCLFLGDGSGGFTSAGTQDTGVNAVNLALADMNLDGRADVIVAGNEGADAVIFLGQEDALAFAWSGSITVGNGGPPLGIAAGDFDGDVKPDIVCTIPAQGWSAGDRAVVLRGLGTGAMSGVSQFPTAGWFPREAKLADVSGDGIGDLVAIGPYSLHPGFASWRKGTGSGGFLAETTVFTPEPRGLVTDDLDADGDVDLAFASSEAMGLDVAAATWLQNLGAGSLALPVHFPVGDVYVVDLAAGDLDADGALDLVLAHGAHGLFVLAGEGGGAFGLPAPWPAGLSPRSIDLHDLDLDGQLDALLASESAGVTMLAGDGSGGFAAPVGVPVTGGGVRSLQLGDFDEDGAVDVVAAISSGDVLWFPGDGTIGLLPAVVIVPDVEPRHLAVGDLDVDQHLDVLVLSEGLLTAAHGDGAGSFEAAGSYDAGHGVTALALGAANSDARPDAIVSSTQPERVCVHFNQGAPDAWVSLGGGIAGATGVPRLQATGFLTAGSTIVLDLEAAPLHAVVLFLGAAQGLLPFKGGTLVPAAAVVLPGLFTNGAGELLLSGKWPAGIPGGTTLLIQAWVVDASAPHGAAGSGCEAVLVP